MMLDLTMQQLAELAITSPLSATILVAGALWKPLRAMLQTYTQKVKADLVRANALDALAKAVVEQGKTLEKQSEYLQELRQNPLRCKFVSAGPRPLTWKPNGQKQ